MTKTPQHNVPELRFPEFEGEWEEKKLGDIASFSKGKSLSKKDISENGVACILYGELYTKYNAFIDEIYSKTSVDKSTLVQGKENQILIPSSGETSEDIATASCLVSNKVVYIGGDINIITPKKDKGRFISLSLNSVNKNEIAKFAQGKSVVHLYNDHLKKTKIKIPNNLNEQEKIGTFFSKLDRQIELEEQKLAKLEEQKKGYMQKIFSQELRFKDESGNEYPEWEEKKLFDVVKYLSSKRSSNYYSEDIIHGQYPVYDAVQEISRDTNFDIEESYISILKDGAGVGRLNLRPGKSSVIGTMGYLLPQNIDIKFLFYYLKTMNFNRFVIGSTIPHLYFKDYSKETILIPIDKSEQIKIGSFFIKLDRIINNKAKKIKVLKQRKQGFLQKMFV